VPDFAATERGPVRFPVRTGPLGLVSDSDEFAELFAGCWADAWFSVVYRFYPRGGYSKESGGNV